MSMVSIQLSLMAKTMADIEDQLEDVRQLWKQRIVENEHNADCFWGSLSKKQQLQAFYSVCKRIFKGDIEEQGTYRYVLYDVFGFDSDAYMLGMDCGYNSIHNLIYRGLQAEEQERKELHERLSSKEQETSTTATTEAEQKE